MAIDEERGARSASDPVERLAALRHEFGEHGGVNMSIEASTTFTVMEAGTMPEIFQGRLGPDDGGCFLYGRCCIGFGYHEDYYPSTHTN